MPCCRRFARRRPTPQRMVALSRLCPAPAVQDAQSADAYRIGGDVGV